jgi:hypothetical protein
MELKIISVRKIYDANTGLFIDAYFVDSEDGRTYQVPLNEANRHYQEILEWVENGGVIVDNGA